MKKTVNVKTEEQKGLEMRQDIFWRNFYLVFFVCAIIYGFWGKWHLDTPTFTIALVILWFARVLFRRLMSTIFC